MPVIIIDTLGRQNPSVSDYKLVGGSDVAIRNAFDLTGIDLADADTLLLDDADVVDSGSNNQDGTKESTGRIQLSQIATYISGASNFTINNAKLLTALSSLESASGAGDENIVIGTDSGDTIVITGNLQVNGTTTTVSSTTITIDDKNIELGSVGSPTDSTADGGGITLKGDTDKTFNWVNASDAWTSSEHIELATGKNLLFNATSGDVTIGYSDNNISNAEGITITINDDGGHAYLELIADGGGSNTDHWAIHNDGNFKLENKISGSYQSFLTITPNATPANSTITIPGKIISNDGVDGSFILSGPNTDNHVTLEMYGDANIEKWKMLDTHTSGLFAFQNYANAAWQTMMSITPHATPADSQIDMPGDLVVAGDVQGHTLTSKGTITISPSTGAADTKILFGDNTGLATSTKWCVSFDDGDVTYPFLFDYGTKVVGGATKFKIDKDGNITSTGTINGTSAILSGDVTTDSIYLRDIGGDHTVRVRLFEDNTGDKELRFKLNDGTRTIDIGGNITVGGTISINNNFTVSGGNGTLDQSVSSGASPVFSMENMLDLPTSALSDGIVTYAKMQDISTDNRVLGRANAVTGTVAEVQIQTGMIADDAVTLSKIQNIDSMRILGRVTVGSGSIEELSTANVKQILSGISDNDFVTIDTPHTTISAGQYARFTSAGLEGRGTAGVRSDLGISDNEIIDWTTDQSGNGLSIHENNTGAVGVDWTADQGATNILDVNLAGSPYFDQLFLTDEIDMTFTGSSADFKDMISVHDGTSTTPMKWIHTLSHVHGPHFTNGIMSDNIAFNNNTVVANLLSTWDSYTSGVYEIFQAYWPVNSSPNYYLVTECKTALKVKKHIAFYAEDEITFNATNTPIYWGKLTCNTFLTLTGNITDITFGSDPVGPSSIQIKLIQDGTGGRTITNWPAACKWPGGAEPLLSTGGNDVDIVSFYFDGTNYYGTIVRDYS